MRVVGLVAVVLAAAILLTASCGVNALRVDAIRRGRVASAARASTLDSADASAGADASIDPPTVKPLTKEQKAKAAKEAKAKAKAKAAAGKTKKVALKATKAKLPKASAAPSAATAAPATAAAPAATAPAATAPAAAASAPSASAAIAAAAAPATAPTATVTADNVAATLTVKTFGRIKGISIEEKDFQRHFENFMRKNKRKYKSADLTERYNQYKKNWKFVDNFNKMQGHTKGTNGVATFKLSTNPYMDYTPGEYKKKLGFKSSRTHASAAVIAANAKVVEGLLPNKEFMKKGPHPPLPPLKPNPRFKQMPPSKNWADDPSVVSPIRFQDPCGACWAFTTVTVVESANAILRGSLAPSSPQHLVDCCAERSGWAPCDGCAGGDFLTAYRFVAQNGLCAWDDYPYTTVQGTCQRCKAVNWISGGAVVAAPGDEVALMAAVNIGPVATAIASGLDTFKFYSSGIYNDRDCPSNFESLDHAVTITGYGTDMGHDYWWIRNQWGETWGEKGYMRIARGQNMCGLALEATQPTARLDPNGPESVMMDRVATEDKQTGFTDSGGDYGTDSGDRTYMSAGPGAAKPPSTSASQPPKKP